MKKNLLRELTIALLDDEYGISSEAYELLVEILPAGLLLELTQAVRSSEGRVYLSENHEL